MPGPAQLTPQEWDELVRAHGGLIGVEPIDQYINDPTDPTGRLPKIENPDPTYEYAFADGTRLRAKTVAEQGTDPTQPSMEGGWVFKGLNVVDANTATALKMPKATAPTFREDDKGNLQMWEPETNRFVPAPGMPAVAKAPGISYEVPRETADPMSGLTQRWAEKGTYVDTKTVGNTLYGLREGGTQYEPIQTFPRAAGADRDPTAANRLAFDMGKYPAEQAEALRRWDIEQAAKKEAAAAAYKQFQEEQAALDARNRLTNTVQFSNDLMKQWAAAAPMAMTPGQTQFFGANPGGLADRIAQMGGFTRDPNAGPVQPVQIDPAEAWRQAQGVIART